MSQFRGHLQRFTCVFARDVPHPGTSPTLSPCFRTRCPTFRDISNVLTPFSSEMSHILGHLQHFYPRFRPKCPTSGDTSNSLTPFSHEMSHFQGHLQRFARVFARDVPHPGTSPTLDPRFRTRCPTFRDISNAFTVFSYEMSQFQGHLQRFTCVFVRDVPPSGTYPTL